MGIPKIATIGLLGKRLEAIRAGIIATTFMTISNELTVFSKEDYKIDPSPIFKITAAQRFKIIPEILRRKIFSSLLENVFGDMISIRPPKSKHLCQFSSSFVTGTVMRVSLS
jgi:hypothetical protein